MLKNIKSTYILKMVLFHLEEVLKLELVKYNKSFQKKIDLSIKNYKEFTKDTLYIHQKYRECNIMKIINLYMKEDF